MADHHHGRRHGKASIHSSQVPGHTMFPKGSSSSSPRTTGACTTKHVVRTSSHKDHYRLEESKHKNREQHSRAVSASVLTEKHRIEKTEKHRIEKTEIMKNHQIVKHKAGKDVIEKYVVVVEKKVIEKHQRIEIKKEVIVAPRVCDYEHYQMKRVVEEARGKKHRHYG